MLDKVEVRVPHSVGFRPGFRFLSGEVRYGGISSPIRRSMHYAGTCDLRPFRIDAILHANFRWGKGRKNHKLEILSTGSKSLRQMGDIIHRAFDVEPDCLELMRLDFASDLDGVTLAAAYGAVRVKLKRSADAIGELDYETVGKRRLEYFRYGKSPNCFRVYDKPAECMARFQTLLKAANPEAELPTFEDLFGFASNAIRTRFERQAGGGRIPEALSTFGRLRNAAEFNPFSALEIIPDSFPFPDPKIVGVARSLKLAGVQAFIERYGYQQARACLNPERNAKRLMDDYREYMEQFPAESCLTVDRIVQSYLRSVARQIDGTVEETVRSEDEIRKQMPEFAA